MMKSVLHLLILTFSSVQPIAWQKDPDGYVKWALYCDYSSDGDFMQVRRTGEECGRKCVETPDCTRFSFNYEGGTCRLKSGKSEAFYSSSTSCGEVITRTPIAWRIDPYGYVKWAFYCDYSSDGDFMQVRRTGVECGRMCVETPDCTRFSFKYEGGTCRLKSGSSEAFYSSSTTSCGEVISRPPIAWQNGTNGNFRLGYNCDYSSDGDIKHVRSTGEECGEICVQTPGCTRFSHSNYQGGTCWLKRGYSEAFYNFNSNCGEVIGRPSIAWLNGTNGNVRWAYNCDYSSDGDFVHVRSPGEECGGICLGTPGCTRFSHDDYEGGTCRLKRGNSEAFYSSNSTCGKVISRPPIAWLNVTNGNVRWAYNCDYSSDGGIKNVRSIDEECGRICVETPGCTRFSHSKYLGGTCWLKRGNSEAFYSGNSICGEVIGRPLGEKTKRCQFPFVTAIFLVKGEENRFLCGGSLISSKHVLTAANCIQSKGLQETLLPGNISVLLGAYNLTSKTELGVQQRDVQEIYVHPDWDVNSERCDADLAVLLFNEVVSFTDHIRPVSILFDDTVMDDVIGSVVGWSLTENGTKLNAEFIKRAYVAVLNRYVCLTKYPDVAVISSIRTFCGQNKEGNVNRVDSAGGVYVQNKESVWVQRGIYSSSITNSTGYVQPVAVYTNVTNFKNWIADTVRKSGAAMYEDETSNKVNLECVFAKEGMTHAYTCILDNLDIQSENVSGAHLSQNTEQDVEVIFFRRGTMFFIPSGIGKIFINVKRIVIEENLSTKHIKRSDFKCLENLVLLKIFKNDISKLDQDTFRDLQHLEVISIVENRLTEIEEGTFATNAKLKEVSLYGNNIVALPGHLFQNSLLLERVIVSNNSLKIIEELAFQTNTKLKNIHLAMNYIEILPRFLLRNNSLLEFVDLKYNSLRIIETDFISLKNIQKIFIHNNICIDAYYEDVPIIDFNHFRNLTEFQNFIRANCSFPDP